ncbi:MAG: Asp-tRNA(Asn)/Glu-tRNA(Gln) amidotransferase subunit GatC [Planctomycetes bacterium]|nr:Asp-tRNA(Asn)/Glu-tRNA(Gln) amidotransferase subunit GatC [Planctomycetota bacterium]
MNINEKLINHIAHLARLEPNLEEKEALRKNLAQILDYIGKLKSIDTDKIEPLIHSIEMNNVLREDKTKPGITREQALSNAPEKEAGFFRVPKIIE